MSGNPPPRREAWKGVADTISARARGGGGFGTDFDCAGGLIPAVAHALRAGGFDASEDGTGRGTPLAPVQPFTLAIRGRGDSHNLEYRQDGTANALLTPNGGRGGIGVGAIAFSAKDHAADASESVAPTMRAMGHSASHANGGGQLALATEWGIRRLTPRECERLMGFPENYSLIEHRGKPASDGPRYKALGNSMAVNVMRWIGRRIDTVERITREAA